MIRQTDIVAIPRSSTNYPKEWSDLKDAPQTLYAVGDLGLLRSQKFTVVGSRRTPAPVLKLGKTVCEELCKNFTLVTGTADGGDMVAIESGLKNGRVICILAGGFSAIPQSNYALLEEVSKRGLLLSPHEYDTPVRTFSFEYRNKLLASLGKGVLVLSAGEKSGALVTAKYAVQFEKPVFAFPYAPNTSAGVGCNSLIKKGARLTETAEDIYEYFGMQITPCPKALPALSEEETAVLALLRELTSAHSNELSAKTGMPVFKLRSILSALEVKGLVASVGGNTFAPV